MRLKLCWSWRVECSPICIYNTYISCMHVCVSVVWCWRGVYTDARGRNAPRRWEKARMGVRTHRYAHTQGNKHQTMNDQAQTHVRMAECRARKRSSQRVSPPSASMICKWCSSFHSVMVMFFWGVGSEQSCGHVIPAHNKPQYDQQTQHRATFVSFLT